MAGSEGDPARSVCLPRTSREFLGYLPKDLLWPTCFWGIDGGSQKQMQMFFPAVMSMVLAFCHVAVAASKFNRSGFLSSTNPEHKF